MKPVLCVIDLSPASVSVLDVAAGLANRFQAPLTILYPYRIKPDKEPIADYRKGLLQKAQKNFLELEQKLHLNGSLNYEFRAEVGFPGDRVEAFFRQHPALLVVMGEKMAMENNESGLNSLQEMIKRIPVPVVVVPDRFESGFYNLTRTKV
ncbi:MAG: universal stress protein [Cyclobacteriaceae bacterium]|nr:universal stress protein [Cyclobacteriaceae bacterium]MCX7638289.1 universal stress protein [Cyclobacteriaceae bacterium]MDW8330193.1 universal stress protein [Cyclobacteriaceae bacterium]